MKPTLVYDIETYRDYFLIAFLNVDTGNVRHFEAHDTQDLDRDTVRQILKKYRLVSFNGNGFDLPLVSYALQGASVIKVKQAADKIIKNNIRPWAMGLDSIKCDHIDLIEVAPGIAGLKIYGGRLHCRKMQDLPIDPEDSISEEQRAQLREYCENDLRTTLELFRKLEPQIALREQMSAQYGIDLRSKSDAQIAEAVIKHEVEKLSGKRIEKEEPFRLAGQVFKYKLPSFLAPLAVPETSPLYATVDQVCSADFFIGTNGVVLDPFKGLKVKLGNSVYQMGIGGLHSTEKSIAHKSDDLFQLIDRDVASYYPAIILNCGLRPANMGEHFTRVYKTIVRERLNAKKLQSTLKARIATLEKELSDVITETQISQAR